MDGQRFDAITRLMTTGRSRRALVRVVLTSAGAAALARLGAGGDAGQVTPAACTANGIRCGPNTPRRCGTCCSGCTARQENGQRRCSCCRDGRDCRRDDQCCSGRCEGGTCVPASCLPFEGNCGGDSDCCSGVCSGGSVCAAVGCQPEGAPCSGEAGEPDATCCSRFCGGAAGCEPTGVGPG